MDLQNQRIIFYDGYCIFCSRFIKFLIKRDKKEQFNYSPLEKIAEYDFVKSGYLLEDLPDSMVYASNSVLYFSSDAVIHIFYDLGGGWKIIRLFNLIPKSIRDFFYKMISKNRYKIFGKSNNCFLPEKKI